MPLVRYVLTGVSVIITGIFIAFIAYQIGTARAGITEANSAMVEQQQIEKLSELYDLNNSELAGSKVVSLIKKYGNVYNIRIKPDATDEAVTDFADISAAIDVIDTRGGYRCKLQRYDSDTSSYVEIKEIDRVTAILFEKLTTKEETRQNDYSQLLQFLGKQGGDANSITQTDIDTLADYITLLLDQNTKLEQNRFYGAQAKLSRYSSWVLPENDVQIADIRVDFVPTDIVVWQDDGNGYYVSLVGIQGSTTEILTNISGVTIQLERDNGTVKKVTIVNDSESDLNVKIYRVGK